MKPKIILLLTVLLVGGLAASPNRNCGGIGCVGKFTPQATTLPVKRVVMMIDEAEMLPLHHFLNNF
jgi:hypothetical protein